MSTYPPIALAIKALIRAIGESPERDGLQDTPERAGQAWMHWTQGYGQDAKDVIKLFDGPEFYDEMILVKGIPFYSHCEHHLAPFFGTVDIGYIPEAKILGLSKFSRIVDIYAYRLQVQERLTANIADAFVEHLEPIGVGVHIRARHLCMESRGIQKQGTETVTTELQGVFKDKPEVRAEFFASIK